MGFKLEVEANIDIPHHLKQVRDDKFWTFAANEWWKLMTPFVPMDSGTLYKTVKLTPKTVEYTSIYAHKMYANDFNFRKDKHVRASSCWDEAAKPTEEPKLIESMQGYVDSGRLNLNG